MKKPIRTMAIQPALTTMAPYDANAERIRHESGQNYDLNSAWPNPVVRVRSKRGYSATTIPLIPYELFEPRQQLGKRALMIPEGLLYLSKVHLLPFAGFRADPIPAVVFVHFPHNEFLILIGKLDVHIHWTLQKSPCPDI
jgi:hypothetical protein